jgi:tetratricopeptide (TPR) repeat protein
MRDEFSARNKRLLAERVGFRCSNPDCRQPTSGPRRISTGSVNIGVAGHISSASKGGPRFDERQTADERSATSNGIWLCQSCGKLIDSDTGLYTRRLLFTWKHDAENQASTELRRGRVRPEYLKPSRAMAIYVGVIALFVAVLIYLSPTERDSVTASQSAHDALVQIVGGLAARDSSYTDIISNAIGQGNWALAYVALEFAEIESPFDLGVKLVKARILDAIGQSEEALRVLQEQLEIRHSWEFSNPPMEVVLDDNWMLNSELIEFAMGYVSLTNGLEGHDKHFEHFRSGTKMSMLLQRDPSPLDSVRFANYWLAAWKYDAFEYRISLSDVYFYSAWSLAVSGMLNDALSYYQLAVRANPDNAIAYYKAGTIAEAIDSDSLALHLFEKCANTSGISGYDHPSNEGVVRVHCAYNAALLLENAGDLNMAIGVLSAGLQIPVRSARHPDWFEELQRMREHAGLEPEPCEDRAGTCR